MAVDSPSDPYFCDRNSHFIFSRVGKEMEAWPFRLGGLPGDDDHFPSIRGKSMYQPCTHAYLRLLYIPHCMACPCLLVLLIKITQKSLILRDLYGSRSLGLM
ncbi:hypothetical protein GDO86_019639 [Hymenochirus boettgeri]|uniref:Uncharacterized protein n=1 Tax=Hymenochirus boettgeri TaxID=247094 RepID=A0A8T2IIS0_9PIPI|nr:hypothetical protein GDO86_019639 [Hymenochirus boettgeri]